MICILKKKKDIANNAFIFYLLTKKIFYDTENYNLLLNCKQIDTM